MCHENSSPRCREYLHYGGPKRHRHGGFRLAHPRSVRWNKLKENLVVLQAVLCFSLWITLG